MNYYIRNILQTRFDSFLLLEKLWFSDVLCGQQRLKHRSFHRLSWQNDTWIEWLAGSATSSENSFSESLCLHDSRRQVRWTNENLLSYRDIDSHLVYFQIINSNWQWITCRNKTDARESSPSTVTSNSSSLYICQHKISMNIEFHRTRVCSRYQLFSKANVTLL